jgi:4-alpha-glucanotransferase
MKRIRFAMGIHNHQPVGNFDFIFEEAYQKAYRPFLELLEKHPKIRLTMHYSGILLEWIAEHHPEYVMKLRTMILGNQVEMMTGGYYEPILTMIPENDRQGQIAKLTQFVRKQTGAEPIGMWCAERVWEPQLAQTIRRAGCRYTVLDDAHFKYAGLEEDELIGYYTTEEMGETLSLFPISEKLRYAIPFQDPGATIEHLSLRAGEDGNRLAVFADDGEKFGNWPETYDHVYTKGWLERFFQAMEANLEWVQPVLFREALEQLPPVGRVYLPTASYREMMHWTLKTKAYQDYEDFEKTLKSKGLYDQYKTFVRGGFWRNFLAKYPESNSMQKKMLRVSRALWAAGDKMPKPLFHKALDHLWAGQCNCPYWHGVFGGLYLPHLRHANFDHLVQAERIMQKALHGEKTWASCAEDDFDGDGLPEILMETDSLNLYATPIGGRLFEMDVPELGINLLNVMTRREEGYHRTLLELHDPVHGQAGEGAKSIHDTVKVKESGLDRLLVRDRYARGGWIDHFLSEGTTPDLFSRCQYEEEGDFVDQPYQHRATQKGKTLTLSLFRQGHVWRSKNPHPVRVEKTATLKAGTPGFDVRWRIRNESAQALDLWFGVENAFAFLSGHDARSFYSIPGVILENAELSSAGEVDRVDELHLTDERLGFTVHLSTDKAAGLWRFPIETVSMSESGFERVYQGSVVLLHWKIRIEAGGEWEFGLSESVIRL